MSGYGPGEPAPNDRWNAMGRSSLSVRARKPRRSERRTPHPSNLREAKAQGRITRRGRTNTRGTWIAGGGQKPRSRPDPSSIDRPIRRRSCPFLPLAAALMRGALIPTKIRRPRPQHRAGRSRSKTTATGESANGTWVRAGGNSSSPAGGSKPAKGATSGTPRAPSGKASRATPSHA